MELKVVIQSKNLITVRKRAYQNEEFRYETKLLRGLLHFFVCKKRFSSFWAECFTTDIFKVPKLLNDLKTKLLGWGGLL